MTVTAPTFVLLHFLGGSHRTWDAVSARLTQAGSCLAIDLPGFGDDPAATGHSVAEMADKVCEAIRGAAPPAWVLVGHSMGAKIAAAVARRAEDGESGLGGLQRMVLIAGSPPAPEPMQDEQREKMLGWFAGHADQTLAEAHDFIGQNVSKSLPGPAHEQAVADVLDAHPAAWKAWLEGGSKEDWAGRIGILQTPTLVIAGADDPELGPEGQRRLTLPHYAHARLVVLPDAKHLLPLEYPDEVSRLILEHAA